jgi:hypothetical protein
VGAVTIQGDDVVIVYEPAELTLRSGEWGRVQMDVENTGNSTLYFEVDAWGVETSGGAWTDVEPDSFKLEPQQNRRVAIDIQSRARPGQEADISDVLVVVNYGPVAKEWDDGSFRVENPHSVERIEFDVVDEFPVTGSGPDAGPLYLLLVIVIAIVIIVAIVMVLRSRGRGGERPERV